MKYDVKGIFPSQSLSDVEKADPKYGLQVGKAIESEWFKKDAGNTRYFSNRDNFHRLKLSLFYVYLYLNSIRIYILKIIF